MAANLLSKSHTGLLIIDIQEKFAPVIPSFDTLIATVSFLIQGFSVFKLPIFVTEQYPRGLGTTVNGIRDFVSSNSIVEKLHFACTGEARFVEQLQSSGLESCLICGVESHICVMQTVMGLLDRKIVPHIVVDGVASRRELDKTTALQRMSQAGAVLTTAETALFELTGVAGTEEFKAISRLVKNRSLD